MSLDECCHLILPNTKQIDDLKKEKLLEFCLSDEICRQYFPEKEKLSEISRGFIINVN
jgi:hypothetical protein